MFEMNDLSKDIHWRERDCPRRAKTVKTASVNVSQKAYYIIEEPDTSGSFGHIVLTVKPRPMAHSLGSRDGCSTQPVATNFISSKSYNFKFIFFSLSSSLPAVMVRRLFSSEY